jgi:hypothetical protein
MALRASPEKPPFIAGADASVANPKFAIPLGQAVSELRIQSDTSNILNPSVVLGLKFAKRGCHEDRANFIPTTLVNGTQGRQYRQSGRSQGNQAGGNRDQDEP